MTEKTPHLAGASRRDGVEQERSAHRPHRHSADRDGRATGPGARPASGRASLRAGAHEPARPGARDLSARRLLRPRPRCPTICWSGTTGSTRAAPRPRCAPSSRAGRSGPRPIPKGETVEQVGERTRRVIARADAVDGDVALFAHAHVLRILAACWIGLPPIHGRNLTLGTAVAQRAGLRARRRASSRSGTRTGGCVSRAPREPAERPARPRPVTGRTSRRRWSCCPRRSCR